jgi:hypothetical protein
MKVKIWRELIPQGGTATRLIKVPRYFQRVRGYETSFSGVIGKSVKTPALTQPPGERESFAAF